MTSRAASICSALATWGLAFCNFSTNGAEKDGSSTPSIVPHAAAPPVAPKHDPLDQPFRRAPMSAASRSIAISLTTNLHVAFDVKLLRTHTAWMGSGLNLFGPPYTGTKAPFICNYDGTPLWTSPPFFPWSVGQVPGQDLRTAPGHSDFKAIDTKREATTLVYELGANEGQLVRIHETPQQAPTGGENAIVRRFEIAPCRNDLWLLAHAEMGVFEKVPDPQNAIIIKRDHDVLLAMASGAAELAWRQTETNVSYVVEVITEEGTDNGNPTVTVAGHQARGYLKIPAHTNTIAIELTTAVVKDLSEANALLPLLANIRVSGIETRLARESANNQKSAAPKTVAGDKTVGSRTGGDEFYRIEHFPVPKESELLVTGMDWLSNGDLAICTWPGEVYVVQNAQGPVELATYRRFARGLNEPLGLRVLNDQIYIVQKCELTRLIDSDNNGEADRYERVNDDWGFTGNYHSFAFGPVIDRQNNFYVALCGQRGRWDVPYVGWCMKINPSGERLEGVCSGLRAPNGLGFYGPDQDLFATDNEGNWIGACKLNHLQPGRYYGYPSGYPAPKEDYGKKKDFQPPALWFPKKLAPSASGFITISNDRFGPFTGQMLVGDFQNAVVLRVFLEKVGGEWQGVVWPFAKGFFSGVNRLSMGPDGKLYIGGLKNRAWPSLGPREFSLDRLSFTGGNPFEVKEVRARPDGFELILSQPVDAAIAENADNYDVAQFTYLYHQPYGSPEVDHSGKKDSASPIPVTRVVVSPDHFKVQLTLEGLRTGYVTRVRVLDVKSAQGSSLWHDTFYYTLNQLPN